MRYSRGFVPLFFKLEISIIILLINIIIHHLLFLASTIVTQVLISTFTAILMAMIIVDALRWWYGQGWLWFARNFFVTKNQEIANFFSFKDLSKTLFSPFRQDASNVQNAPFNIKLQTMGMNLVSRFFGFFIRTGLLLTGLIVMLFSTIFGFIANIGWPFVPVAPLIGLLFLALGVGGS